ncbi:minor capsid protein [Clostridium brassicae]|uniref:Minor capsid protein n=1 Tax=Clostridium brassicae TaxID=2999072 RepID=A0ABT4D979_9CLOT|nr:minor capsid protein [Clostridium brassicae]MCY6958855.1 minor capsid protein [Clostridium brassicae]
MKSKAYWKKRAENISDYEFQKVDNYKLKMEREYRQTFKSIQDDVENFYRKFAKNNEISLIEAKKLLNSNELREFKMDLREFTKKAKDNKNLQWEKELNNVSYKVRVTRLQALQTQIRNQIESLYTKQQNNTTGLLSEIHEDNYYRNIFEMYKGVGININFVKLDTNTISKAIREPWYKGNYSSRIWNNKEILIKELQANLLKAFTLGISIDKTSKIIANKMNVGIGRARRLVNTESAYIASKATFDSYSKSGVVKQYEILATLDLRTSKICRFMDGKIFKVDEKEIGINAPPFHPNCRTTTIAYFPDAVDEERIARDPVTSKNKYVPGNMKYEDWYKENVTNNRKAFVEEKKIQNKSSDKQQFWKYKEVLEKEMPTSFDKFQEFKYNNVNEWDTMKDYYKSRVEGDISAFSTLGDYKLCKNKIQNNLIGITTPNGVKIESYSKHFIDRVLGTSNDPKTNAPRDGVEVEGIKNALEKPLKIKEEPRKESHKIIGEKVTVSINPKTGNLIQCNPTDSDLVRRLKGV